MVDKVASFLKEQTEIILAKVNLSAEGTVEKSVESGHSSGAKKARSEATPHSSGAKKARSEATPHYRVEIVPKDKDDLSLLIGYHGQTLNALQVILGLLTFKKFGEFSPVLVEAGGYRREREIELQQRALEAADKARFLLKEVSFPAMPPFERRLIHIALSEESGVRTESRGEGRERHIVVVPEGKADSSK